MLDGRRHGDRLFHPTTTPGTGEDLMEFDGSPALTASPLKPPLVERLGRLSWALLGIIIVCLLGAVALGTISGILIPLVIAVILGTLLEPIARWLRSLRVPRTLSVVLTLLLLAVIGAGVVMIVISGFVRQLPEISRQLLVGWDAFVSWGRNLDLDPMLLEQARSTFYAYAPQLGQGVLGLVSTTFWGAVSLGLGLFFALFFLFFVIRDHDRFPLWVASFTPVDPNLAVEVDRLAQESLRGYFKGVAVTALITAPIFMIPLVVLRVPLVVPIFILYFVLSFIPYIGAWITAAFAVLIAFGSGGAPAALIVTLSLLVSNGTIQSAVSSWALGASLKLHPVAVLLATIVGGAVAGLLGMVLAPPLLAAVKSAAGAVSEHRALSAPTAAQK